MVGGTDVFEAAQSVMLEEVFSPVIAYGYHGDNPFFVPTPSEVFQTGSGYIVRSERGDEKTSAESLKVMRARYLLWNAFLMKQCGLDRLPYPNKQEYIAKFHGGKLFISQMMVNLWKAEEAESESP